LPVGNTPEKVQESLENNNLAFIFAPAFHPALKPLAPIRQSLNHPTIFNYLGPILNPLENLTAQVIGVSSVEIGEKLAEVCLELKKKALIVHDLKFGLDDVSIGGGTSFWEVNLNEGKIFTGKISPENYGIDSVEKFSEIQGGKTPEENKDIFKDLLENKASKARQNFMEINYLVIKGFFEKIIKDN
jgi:anthranilate phosphoribosyltransferase